MKILRLWIGVIGLSGFLSSAAIAQEAGTALVTPSKATAIAGAAQKLVPGKVFTFQLQFDRAPEGYGGGEVAASFAKVGEPAYPTRFARIPERGDASVSTEERDGQAIYKLSLKITEDMSPGKWKLTEISLGRSTRRTYPVPEDVSFDILGLRPMMIHVQAPTSIEAGQLFVIVVTLDEYPRDISKDCWLMLNVRLKQTSPLAPIIELPYVELSPNQLSYKFSHRFEPDFPSGGWLVEVSDSAGNRQSNYLGCRYPLPIGDVHVPFRIEPAKGLVTPTSVVVTVNPSQVELLRGEADRLRAKARLLEEKLSAGNLGQSQNLLRNEVDEALKELDQTEKVFKEKGLEPTFARAINVFFDDIRRTYGEAIKAVTEGSAWLSINKPRLMRVNDGYTGLSARSNRGSKVVLDSISHNVKAYDVAASSKLLTFTLHVYSSPQGASVSYKLRGNDYQALDHETDWQIENLPRAVYFVLFHKEGCGDEERTFDAIANTSDSVKVELKCRRGKS